MLKIDTTSLINNLSFIRDHYFIPFFQEIQEECTTGLGRLITCAYVITALNDDQSVAGAYIGITTDKIVEFTWQQNSLKKNYNSSTKLQQHYNKFRIELDPGEIIDQKFKFTPLFEFAFDPWLNHSAMIEVVDQLRHIEHEILVHIIKNTNIVLYNTELTEGSREQRLQIVMDWYQRFLAYDPTDPTGTNIRKQENFSREDLLERQKLLAALFCEMHKFYDDKVITDNRIDIAKYSLAATYKLNTTLYQCDPIVSTKTGEYMPNLVIAAVLRGLKISKLKNEINHYDGKKYTNLRRATLKEMKTGAYDPAENFKFDSILSV